MSSEPINNVDLSGYGPGERAIMERGLEIMGGPLRWDHDDIEKATHRSWTTIARFYQGKPQGDVSGVIADIERMIEGYAQTEYAPTPVSLDYERVLDNCRRDGRMGIMVGDSGRSKTITATDWTRRHQRMAVVHVQCPSYCPRADLASLLCSALGIKTDVVKQTVRERELMKTLTPRHMLIIDECGYLVGEKRKNSPLRLLQDLHDACHCPIVLIMRPTQYADLISGRNATDDVQFLGRCVHRALFDCKDLPYKKDEVEPIVRRHYKGDISATLRKAIRAVLQRDIGGLRTLGHDLKLAAEFAKATGQPFDEAFCAAGDIRETPKHLKKLEDF